MTENARKSVLLGACLVAVLLYGSRTVKVFIAERLVESRQQKALERAIVLVPDDVEFRRLLGLKIIAGNQNYGAAIANLRQATSLNPNRAQTWLDLASVYQIVGDIQAENACSRAAVEAEPNNPETLAEAGEFELTSGEVSAALPLFRRSLERNPRNAPALIPLCWRASRNVARMFDQVLPADPEAQFAFLRMLSERHEDSAADETWHRILVSGQPFPPRWAFSYLDYLIKEQSVLRLDRAWDELSERPDLRYYFRSENRVVNPSFELPVLDGGLDWRYEPAENIHVALDDTVAHSGYRSLRLSYEGKAAYDSGWKQFIPVHPGSDYEFSVWIKSDGLTSSSGPRLVIVDAYTGVALATTDDCLDTHDWHILQETFRIPFETQLVAVTIIRSPANTAISGRMWIDDMELVRR